MSNPKQTVVFDFDGVIHSYTSGWKGIDVIPDPPVEGIGRAISQIRDHYKVVVVSTRCASESGRKAIEEYLKAHGIEVDGIEAEKPPAVVYIDDRAICFDGHADTLLFRVLYFKPWTDTAGNGLLSRMFLEIKNEIESTHAVSPNVLYVTDGIYDLLKAQCLDISAPNYSDTELTSYAGLKLRRMTESGYRWAIAHEHIIGGGIL